jgi:cyclase
MGRAAARAVVRLVLTRRVIPCLDVRDGRVVKGVQFLALRDSGAPAELAARYERDGADEIVILDVSATAERRRAALRTVRDVRDAVAIPLTVGGGVRTVADARALLDNGADKVSLNTAAYRSPHVVSELASRFGSQCVTVSIDATSRAGAWRVVIGAGTESTVTTAISWAQRVVELGAGEILLTSIDRDGTQSGYELGLIEEVAARVSVPVVASGGARTGADLVAAARAGADAVLAASILHDGLATVRALKDEMAVAGIEVRR